MVGLAMSASGIVGGKPALRRKRACGGNARLCEPRLNNHGSLAPFKPHVVSRNRFPHRGMPIIMQGGGGETRPKETHQ